MKTRLTRSLQIGFGVSLAILVISSIASYNSIANLIESAKVNSHTYQVLGALESTLSVMKDAETGQRGYLLTNDTDFLQPYNGASNRALRYVEQFQFLTKNSPDQEKTAASLRAMIKNRLGYLKVLIDKKKAGGTITAPELLNGKLAMDSLRIVVGRAELAEKTFLNKRLRILSQYTFDTPFFLFIASLVAVAISLFSYFRVMNEVKQRSVLFAELQSQEQQTASLNEQLAITNEELASANRGLEAANEEINASNEDLAAANQELVDANQQLIASEESIRILNEKLGFSNEELSATVNELFESQQNLTALKNELEERVASRTAALTESESRYRVIMETMQQIAWESKPDGTITFFNGQWYKYTGLSEIESIGWGWTNNIHPDDLPYALEKYKLILESSIEGEFEFRKKRNDGNYRWHLARMQPVRPGDGEVKQWVGTATDIHELKTLQQQKDDFISIASHELKTPITSLKASLQLLDRLKDTPSALTIPKLISQANKSLGRLNNLVEDLLNVSKLNQGQISLNRSSFVLHQLVNDCCQYIQLEKIYRVVIIGDRKLAVYADMHRVEQVIVNFLNNAIKYAPDSKEIIIVIENKEGMARVSVTDKGPGIAPEKLPHLFDRYFRVDSGGVQFSGLGLGLYISAEIIKKHGGEIGVDSEMGKGSSFWFTIPQINEGIND